MTSRFRWTTRVPAPLVAVVLFGAWTLRSELRPGSYPNDGSFHRAYLGWAADRLGRGDSPLDGIFPQLGLGFPIFQHYQVLPHLLLSPVAWLFGVDGTYSTALYLLLVLWPVCVYVSARLFELDRPAATAAAVVAPFVMSGPGYGFELGSYVWRGWGMWSQAWGMWLFALAAAVVWRAVFRQGSPALAAALMAALFCSHLLTGLTLAAVVLAWPLTSRVPGRWSRTLMVLGGGGVASAWLLVPSWIDHGSTAFANPEGTFWRDSYGTGQVLSWLVGGELFDAGRLPVLTVLLAVGLAVLAHKARVGATNARALLALFGVSLVLFFGTSAVGPVVDRMPLREVLFLHRMIVGVHYAGILAVGIGAAAVLRRLPRRIPEGLVSPRLRPALLALGCVVALGPAWTQSLAYLDEQAEWVGQQHAAERTDGADFAALVATASTGGGRIYAGSSGNWGKDYRIGHVPGYIELLNLGARGVGFVGRVPALTEPSEGLFDPDNRAQADVYDVRWQLRPAGLPGPPGAILAESRGRHHLWWTETSGVLQLAMPSPAIPVGPDGVAVASREFLRSDLARSGVYPLLGRLSSSAGPAAVDPTQRGAVGRVFAASAAPGGDRYAATVIAERPAIVVAKTSSHRRWSARVDGRPAATEMVAPGLLAVAVPPGQHQVTLRFAGFPSAARLGLLALGAVTLAGLAHSFGRRGSISAARFSEASASTS